MRAAGIATQVIAKSATEVVPSQALLSKLATGASHHRVALRRHSRCASRKMKKNSPQNSERLHLSNRSACACRQVFLALNRRGLVCLSFHPNAKVKPRG